MNARIIMSLFATICLVSACSKDKPAEVELVKLGGRPKKVQVETIDTTCSFEVISNVPYTAKIIQGSNWTSFSNGGGSSVSGDGNGTISIDVNANTGIKRTAKIVLEHSNRSDTLRINQECRAEFDEYINLSQTSVTIPADGGKASVTVTTNVMHHLITPFAYSDRILGLSFKDGVLSFRADANDTHNPVNTKITLSFVNGWEEIQSSEISVFQNFL